MAIRALYENIDGIDQSNPGYGFICAVDTAAAIDADDTIELIAEGTDTAGLDFDVEEVTADNPELGNVGINTDVAQRATGVQVEVAATG